MSSLRDLQNRFGEFLSGSGELDAGCFTDARLAQNASIHRNNVNHAHAAALAANFPAVRSLLGEQCFDVMAALYCSTTPTTCAVLAEYGGDVPAFIEGRTEFAELPFLSDVARLEWAANLSLHAACDKSLTPEGLALLAQPAGTDADVHLTPVSSLQLLATPYPAEAIRRAAIENDADRLSRIAAAPQWLATYRTLAGLRIESLTSGEFSLLSSLGRSSRLSPAFAEALAVDPALQLPETIGRFLQLGLLAEASSNRRNPSHEHRHND